MATNYNTSQASVAVNQRHVRPLRAIHNVSPGESLGSIANIYGLSEWELRRNNSHQIGRDGEVHPGMRLYVH